MGKLIVESRASSCQLGVHTPSLSPLFTRTSAKRINYRARLLMRYPRIVERTWKGGKRNISWEEESQLLCERCKKEKEKVKISSSKRVFFFLRREGILSLNFISIIEIVEIFSSYSLCITIQILLGLFWYEPRMKLNIYNSLQ